MLKLVSDFHDYYDHHFDREGRRFYRMAEAEDKLSALFILRKMGLSVGCFGLARHIFAQPDEMLVVHTDPLAHRGEGKMLMRFGEIPESMADCLCTQYHDGCGSVSFRYLRIGDAGAWLRYESDDPWRSNNGNVTITKSVPADLFNLVREIGKRGNFPLRPLWAIDFVGGFAVDFNSSPGIAGTPIEEGLKPSDIAELIRRWFADRGLLEARR